MVLNDSNRDRQESQDQQALLEHVVSVEEMELPEDLDKMEILAHQDAMEHQEHQACL